MLLGIARGACAVPAYARIRARDFAAHRAWMIRTYALTFAVTMLRIELLILHPGAVRAAT